MEEEGSETSSFEDICSFADCGRAEVRREDGIRFQVLVLRSIQMIRWRWRKDFVETGLFGVHDRWSLSFDFLLFLFRENFLSGI